MCKSDYTYKYKLKPHGTISALLFATRHKNYADNMQYVFPRPSCVTRMQDGHVIRRIEIGVLNVMCWDIKIANSVHQTTKHMTAAQQRAAAQSFHHACM